MRARRARPRAARGAGRACGHRRATLASRWPHSDPRTPRRYAAWDLAFHCLPLAMVDPEWAKRQLVLMLREWYMHPSGALPAYEWSFDDVNPPVHAWACLRVYQISGRVEGVRDVAFLERCFHKLLLNFTWWVNRRDSAGKNLFDGGFLGLDNIGLYDRSSLPAGYKLEQADATAWMAMYCLSMLGIALELAMHNRVCVARRAVVVAAPPSRARARPAAPAPVLTIVVAADVAATGTARATDPQLRGQRHQVFRALRAHRRGHGGHHRGRRRAGGRHRCARHAGAAHGGRRRRGCRCGRKRRAE